MIWLVLCSPVLIYSLIKFISYSKFKAKKADILASSTSASQKLDALTVLYQGKGFRVQTRSENSIQFLKPKKFSFVWAFLWSLCFGVGLVIYSMYYLAKSDKLEMVTL
ncbi:MAG: hypothetical protein PHE67_08010 [Campylobacterales bacterium]|nr:hypothetical protein [Campylobacterales bacterium]